MLGSLLQEKCRLLGREPDNDTTPDQVSKISTIKVLLFYFAACSDDGSEKASRSLARQGIMPSPDASQVAPNKL